MNSSKRIDFQSISEWIATGFFLGDTSFFFHSKNVKSEFGPNFDWYYSPRNISFNTAVDEFSDLIESLVAKNTIGKKVILPISGGLDSRTLATSLKNNRNISTYSYEFENGISETKYANKIAKIYNWDFKDFIIPKGYLWDIIDILSNINLCQVEFTHPRQMAVMNQISELGDIILSGQWGDVLFDSPEIKDEASIKEETNFIIKKIAKPGGIELSKMLWDYWDLDGDFYINFFNKIKDLIQDINIPFPSSRARAFKSIHWANRWANSNLKIFAKYKEVYTPYYDNEMCDFICTIPEKFLSKRKIKIEYIKRKSPELARVPWQGYDLDLYNYKYFNSIFFYKRVFRYTKRIINQKLLKSKSPIERNWELQFLGSKNEKFLKRWLFEVPELNDLVPKNIVESFYQKFKKNDRIKYSHPISMLLTLSVWCKRFWKKN